MVDLALKDNFSCCYLTCTPGNLKLRTVWQVKDFLQRVRGKRFPPIEKDMKMVLAHCGSLFLDPGCTSEVYRHMVLLERIHQEVAEFSPGVSMEALMQRPLRRN